MTVTETAARPVRRLKWQLAQLREIVVETYRAKSLVLQVANWRGHLSGQHLDIRLTAEDGYQAQRSYSIASPPEDELLTLTVERVDNGEVSPYLVDDLHVGDADRLAALMRPVAVIDGSQVLPRVLMRRSPPARFRGDRTAIGVSIARCRRAIFIVARCPQGF